MRPHRRPLRQPSHVCSLILIAWLLSSRTQAVDSSVLVLRAYSPSLITMVDISLLFIYVIANFTTAYGSFRSLPAYLSGGAYTDMDEDGSALSHARSPVDEINLVSVARTRTIPNPAFALRRRA